MKDNADEFLPIVDNKGIVVAKATRAECHAGTFLLHPVVHLHVINNKGELYLQQRPHWKQVQPGKWDTAVGGHVAYGEEIEIALIRETGEELGIKIVNPKFIISYNFKSNIEAEQVNIFITSYNEDITPSDETNGGRFWSINEIVKNIQNGIFTPNFVDEFTKYIYPYMSCFSILNLPPLSAKLFPTQKGFKIYDNIRKKFVALTPEEAVRQRFTNWLTSCLKYPKSLICNETQIRLNDTVRRCDTILFDSNCKPLMIIEYKAPTIELSQATFDQIIRYNMVLEAKYLVVSNGIKHYACVIDYHSKSYRFLEQIPSYDKLI